MSYQFTKGGMKIYRCSRCGTQKAEVVSNSDMALKGSYIMDGSLTKLDKER